MEIRSYTELAAPTFLDDNNWNQLTFDLASGHQVLTDLRAPEMGSGYVYRDSREVGSAAHNRFIYWRTVDDTLELVELSTEVDLEVNQVRIKFVNSPVIGTVNVIEHSDSVEIVIATLSSAHRIDLPHPKVTSKSIFFELTNDILYNPANYYTLNANLNQQPLCATSWHHHNLTHCALGLADGTLLVVQFGRHNVTTFDITQVGMLSRLWSRMPKILGKNPEECDSAIISCASFKHEETQDVLLFALCRDSRVCIFSINNRCTRAYHVTRHQDLSQSFSNNSIIVTGQPMMRVLGSNIAIYLPGKEEFVILSYSYSDHQHILREGSFIPAPTWEKLIDFSISDDKIWTLSSIRGTDSAVHYVCLSNASDSSRGEFEEWEQVYLVDESGSQITSGQNLETEIFWRNRFSIPTIRKALQLFGQRVDANTLESLQAIADTTVQGDKAWEKFYAYCCDENRIRANKKLGLIVSQNESLISIVRSSSPSFVVPMLMSAQEGPYCGVESTPSVEKFMETLHNLSMEVDYVPEEEPDDKERKYQHVFKDFREKLYSHPAQITQSINDLIDALIATERVDPSKLNLEDFGSIDHLCEQLDLTSLAETMRDKILQDSTRMRSDRHPLSSNSGILITFDMFRRLVQARMLLARDLLIYIHIKESVDDSEDLIISGKVESIANSLRSYAILVWMTETHIKGHRNVNPEVLVQLTRHFEFFKKIPSQNITGSTNLLLSFLSNGGFEYSAAQRNQTVSSSKYVIDVAIDLCKLLWPSAGHNCFPEFLLTYQLDDQLGKYLELTDNWLHNGDIDRQYFRAANGILQNRGIAAVEIFNNLLFHLKPGSLISKFVGIDNGVFIPGTILKYYDKVTHLFQMFDDYENLISLINTCISLLDPNADQEQQTWVNSLRAKLFLYYLEVKNPDDAYHTMVLTDDLSLRYNCLRKFVVHHCEAERWNDLLSYPFIDIKEDFIKILYQKAESSDLAQLAALPKHKTTYYDLLYANYIAETKEPGSEEKDLDDEESYRKAAEVMYHYATRLAHEVPGILSIRKQTECLRLAMYTLLCANSRETLIDSHIHQSGKSNVSKRAHNSETNPSSISFNVGRQTPSIESKISLEDLQLKYEMTLARLRLLEKDPTANAIALSPLKPEEIIGQLVASSMFSSALRLAVLFRKPMEPIFDGLTAKYISAKRLTKYELAMNHSLERELNDILKDGYSLIDTHPYIADSSCSVADKLWRLINYYLGNYDGVNHRWGTDRSSNGTQTVLLRVVSEKLLSSSCDVPASVRRLYMSRNISELLKLLIKYDRLVDAADLAIEMIAKVTEHPPPIRANDPQLVYLPTHLINLLITYLEEDATNIHHIKTASVLRDRLGIFKKYTRAVSDTYCKM